MKRIALIVSSAVMLVAGSGVASARSILQPYPAGLMSNTQRVAPDTAYRLLNPVSQKKHTSSQGYLPRAYVPGGSSSAVAGAIQRAGSHAKKSSHAAVTRGGGTIQTTSPGTSQSPPPPPPGWMIGGPVGSATYLIPLPSSAQ